MSEFDFKTPDELAEILGGRLRSMRIARGLDQREVAVKAGIHERTLGDLERGTGGRIDSLLRVLKALDGLQGLDALAPAPTVDPLALLRHATPARRVRRPRKAVPS